MVIDTPFFHCFFCGRRFGTDPLAQDGSFIQEWKVAACARCISGNSLGLTANHPAIKKLAQNGMVLGATTNGFYAWPKDAEPRYWNAKKASGNRS